MRKRERARRRSANRQPFQRRPCWKAQPQPHADPVYQLPGMQIVGAAHLRKRAVFIGIQRLGRSAGQMHRHKRAGPNAGIHHRSAHVSLLVTGGIERHAQRRRNAAPHAFAHQKHRHVRIVHVARPRAHADRRHAHALNAAHQRFQKRVQPCGMLKHAVGLPKSALALRDGEQFSLRRNDTPAAREGNGRGVAAGIDSKRAIH